MAKPEVASDIDLLESATWDLSSNRPRSSYHLLNTRPTSLSDGPLPYASSPSVELEASLTIGIFSLLRENLELTPTPRDIARAVRRLMLAIPPRLWAAGSEAVPLILKECATSEIHDASQIAYVLATAQGESAFQPVEEVWGPTEEQETYENNAGLGNTQAGDGYTFRGRGYVQLTGRTNYQKWSNLTGVDLVDNPDAALVRPTALTILVQGMRDAGFTRYKLSDFILEYKRRDFYNARKIVNPGELTKRPATVQKIATQAEKYHEALILLYPGRAPQFSLDHGL